AVEAKANLEKAQADFDRSSELMRNKVTTRDQFDAARNALAVAKARSEAAELQPSYTTITAPADGRIGKKNVEVGNRIQPGPALFAVVEPEVWIAANFKET